MTQRVGKLVLVLLVIHAANAILPGFSSLRPLQLLVRGAMPLRPQPALHGELVHSSPFALPTSEVPWQSRIQSNICSTVSCYIPVAANGVVGQLRQSPRETIEDEASDWPARLGF